MYLFNPDNDLALANFSANYTPPASALKIARDLAIIPLWYAPDGTKIVAEGDENNRFLQSIQHLFLINASLIPFSEIGRVLTKKIVPWGWNPSLRKKLSEVNVREDDLPSLESLKRLREYSGRQYAVKMLRELRAESDLFCGESHFFTTLENVLLFLASQSGNCVLKMPNSGSGKGLIWILGTITDKQIDWVKRVLKIQGGVVAEPMLNKARDFAMEFYADNGNIRFAGYSLFRSAASGAYLGNELMSDKNIEEILSYCVPVDILSQVQWLLLKKLPHYFPHYTGYLGVDMMVCETADGYFLQPCVEINMRMNMGMVARIFYDRFVFPKSTGSYAVDFFKKQGEALAHHQKMTTLCPLVIEDGKIKSGYLNLTPVVEDTNYVAWVEIKYSQH